MGHGVNTYEADCGSEQCGHAYRERLVGEHRHAQSGCTGHDTGQGQDKQDGGGSFAVKTHGAAKYSGRAMAARAAQRIRFTAITMAGMARRKPSNRSSMPPWPGSKVPESLTPALRLKADSSKSPSVEVTATTTAQPIHCPGESTGQARANSQPPAMASPMPPIRPSTVLFGLTWGRSLVRPRTLPTRYAPVSLVH